jgi:hypothetical protein
MIKLIVNKINKMDKIRLSKIKKRELRLLLIMSLTV